MPHHCRVPEAFSTFCLVFADIGTIVINDMSGGAITHGGITLVVCLVIMAMIQNVAGLAAGAFAALGGDLASLWVYLKDLLAGGPEGVAARRLLQEIV